VWRITVMNEVNTQIVKCTRCGAKNRIPLAKADEEAKCGKCGEHLRHPDPYVLRCTECGSRNRIPPARANEEAHCGKCGGSLKVGELFAQQPFMVTETNFNDKVLKSPLPALVFAWATWCPTCRTAMPVIDEFAGESKGKIRVGKLNVDNSPSISSTYNILSVPQILVFDNGQMKESMPGALPKHEIMMKMAGYIHK
jgi:thioredoxin 2